MLTYTLRRLFYLVPTLLGITVVTFLIINLAPGDPVSVIQGGQVNARISPEAYRNMLELYGLDEPRMHIDLTLDNGNNIRIEIGDRTPNGQGYYIKLADSKDVYTVDYTWYNVFERLVLDPPYPKAEEE